MCVCVCVTGHVPEDGGCEPQIVYKDVCVRQDMYQKMVDVDPKLCIRMCVCVTGHVPEDGGCRPQIVYKDVCV